VIEATTVRVEQSAFEVTFPVGNVVAPSEPLPTTTPTTAAGGNLDRSEGGEEKGGGGFPAPAFVAIAVAVAALAAAAGWRTRRRSADPDPAAAEIEGAHELVGLLALTDSPVVAVAGEGALDAVRAVLHDRESSGAIVLATAETEQLGDEELPASATVVRDPAAVLSAVEVAHLQQARLKEENGDAAGGAVSKAEMVVVVPAALDADQARGLRAMAESGVGVRLVVVGEGPTTVLPDGHVTSEGQPNRRVVMRAATSQTESELAPATVQESPGRVTVRVLGPLHVSAAGEVGSGMRSKARELLAFLAVHRDGVTTDAALEALWPDERPEDAYFRTIIGNIRTSLRSAASLDDSVAVVERSGPRRRLRRPIEATSSTARTSPGRSPFGSGSGVGRSTT
jgi:hypothetical protein